MHSNSELLAYFNASDLDRSGFIDAGELQQCLSNGTWKPFNIDTIKLMISLFEHKQHPGCVGFEEFCGLWRYIFQWQQVFNSYDTVISFIPADNMLQLNVTQVHQSLVNSGYTFPIEIIQHLMNKFHPPVAKRVTFDDYVHICILIQRITKFFSRFDREKSGIATVSYFEFITGVFDLCHFNASEDGGITSGVPPLPPKS